MQVLLFGFPWEVHDVSTSQEELINLLYQLISQHVAIQVEQEETQFLTGGQKILGGGLIARMQTCQRDGLHGRRGYVIRKGWDILEKLMRRHVWETGLNTWVWMRRWLVTEDTGSARGM